MFWLGLILELRLAPRRRVEARAGASTSTFGVSLLRPLRMRSRWSCSGFLHGATRPLRRRGLPRWMIGARAFPMRRSAWRRCAGLVSASAAPLERSHRRERVHLGARADRLGHVWLPHTLGGLWQATARQVGLVHLPELEFLRGGPLAVVAWLHGRWKLGHLEGVLSVAIGAGVLLLEWDKGESLASEYVERTPSRLDPERSSPTVAADRAQPGRLSTSSVRLLEMSYRARPPSGSLATLDLSSTFWRCGTTSWASATNTI